MMMMKPLKRRSSDSNNKPTVKAKAPNQPSPSSKTSEASELEMLRAKVAMLESQLKENSNVAQVTALPDGGSDSSSEDEPEIKSANNFVSKGNFKKHQTQTESSKPHHQNPPLSPSPPGVLRPSTYSNRASPASSDASGKPLKTIRRASFGKDSSAASSSKPSRSASPEDLLDKHFPAPTLGAPKGGELGE
jgi:hypothetical protein